MKKLDKNSIDNLAKVLKKSGALSIPLEIFFDTIIALIDPHNVSINENIQEMMNECHFNSMNETNSFLQKYNEFINSSIGFIDLFALIDDNENEIESIFQAFYKNGNLEKNYQILNESIDHVLEKTIEVYEINMDLMSSLDDHIGYLESIFKHKETAFQMATLMSISVAMHKKEVEVHDLLMLRENFIILVSFVFVLNEYRKEEYVKTKNNQFFTPRTVQEKLPIVGRNEPCPCGSGKKYKKCCINKNTEIKVDPFAKLDLPMATHFPLSRNEIDTFYSLWSRLINFTNKLFSKMKELKYTNLYFKDDRGKYTLTQEALLDSLYLELRAFLLANFDRIIDEFIDSNKISKENIKLLKEWKQKRLYSDNFFIYENSPVGAIIWDISHEKYYHLYDLYDSVYDLSRQDTMLSMLLLPYKGRIIFDGVIGQNDISFGQNSKDMFLKDYISLREKTSVCQELPNQSSTTKIYQLKISIKSAKPPIWRRVLIEDDITYQGMHDLIQNLFDWYDGHLHEFIAGQRRYTNLEFDDGFMDDLGEDENKFTIGEDLIEVGDKIIYLYDFGDDWMHEILLEDILEKEQNKEYPKCIKGKGRGPLEDIGGIWIYNDIVKAYKEANKEILEEFYVDDNFDPNEFDLSDINQSVTSPT